MVLRATLEPKLANESLAKNGSKCGLFLHFLLYVGMPWHAESMLRKPQVLDMVWKLETQK
jgi:hypothetical protein